MVGPRRLPPPTRPLQAGAIQATLAANRKPGLSVSQRILAPLGNSTNRRTAHSLPQSPDQPAQICGYRFGPNLSELQLSTRSNAAKSNRGAFMLRAWFLAVRISAANSFRISMGEEQKPRAFARGFRKT